MSAPLIVVGDRFAGFARCEGVVTVAQARTRLTQLHQQPVSEALTVRFGQGISDYEHDLLTGDAERLGLLDKVLFEWMPVALAGRQDVHKNRQTNVLIADLYARDDEYLATLRIHNDNELLLDHQTGLHVQGMLVSEAARQMFLAVAERYVAPSPLGYEYYHVIEKMATTYENFLFPLNSTVTMRVLSRHSKSPTSVRVTCEIEIHQAGRRCALVEVTFTAFAPDVIGAKEARRANAAVMVERSPREPINA